VLNTSREDGFSLVELMVASTVMLLVIGTALTTFKNALTINDSAAQLADANQNLRAGTNQLIRDLMMAGRIIGPGGIALPTAGIANGSPAVIPFYRPSANDGPPVLAAALTFNLVADDDSSLNLPDISTGSQKGPVVANSATDMVTIMTIDEFMPVLQSPPANPAVPTVVEGTIAPDGSSVLLPATSVWLVGDTVNDTPKIQKGDLVFFKNPLGNSLQTVTDIDLTRIYFGAAPNSMDPFNFNQRNVLFSGNILSIKCNGSTAAGAPCPLQTAAAYLTNPFPTTSMFRAMMITYFVDYNATDVTTCGGTPCPPRLTRQLNACPTGGCAAGSPFAKQALAGVVEDLDLTYDLVDNLTNPTNITSLPVSITVAGVTTAYNANQIRKVNVHVGVRSEMLSKPTQDYVRNHISTAVDVRSLASVDRYTVAACTGVCP
jgi:type II secretory pathway pseudopilin PulG